MARQREEGRPKAGRRRAGQAGAGTAGSGPHTQGLVDRRRGPRSAQERGNSGGGHSCRAALDGRRAALMPGNSRNASKRVVSKKGAVAGSGGKNRSSLKGRGKTLPADERPWHKGYSGTEKLPEKTARKQDKERKAAAAEGRAPKIGQPGSKDTTWGRGGGRGAPTRSGPQRGGSKVPGRGGPRVA